MSDETPRVPPGPGDVVREVRGLSGVPWRRLARYLRPHLGRFALALVGLVLSAGLGLLFPLLIAQITTVVVAGGEMAGLDRIVLLLIVLFSVQAVGSFPSRTSWGWWGSGSWPGCDRSSSRGS